jgi:two-component system sensor histidine kinase MprB
MRQVDPSHVELLVTDQGPGIPAHERELVFERFFRSTTARAMPGSGLGLAIVKQVVLKHGGALRVEDAVPGGEPPGTSFYVLLPGGPISVVPESEADDDAEPDVTTAAKEGNSPGAANVVSVDSQSTRAR